VIYALSSTFRAIGWILAVLVLIGWVLYLVVNIRQARPEIGSEIELAANRKELPRDEEFEGPRLEKVQAFGVAFLAITVIALPLYWLLEPGRQAGATRGASDVSISRGQTRYEESCAGCHGANLGGGVANPPPIIDVPDPEGGEPFKVKVNWRVPSLDDVFKRFDTDISDPSESTEVRQIITYGRAPVMPAWGEEAGGNFTGQQVQELVDYLWSVQITDEEAQERAAQAFDEAKAAPENEGKSDGQILFELHCARCHTPNWIDRGAHPQDNGTIVVIPPGPPGAGRYGPALNRTTLLRLFPTPEEQAAFIAEGASDNVPYGDPASGIARQGDYGMPGFGRVLSEEEIMAIVEYERSLVQDEDPTYGVVEVEEQAEEGEASAEGEATDEGTEESTETTQETSD
jgi:mono/diheme cytochrome c family protein